MKGIEGKRVLITAGAAGIGRAAAEAFQAAGARVAVCDLDSEACAEMRAANPEIMVAEADVTDMASCDAFFDAALAHLGGVDVVWANAGIGGPAGAIEDLDLEGWRATLSVNLDGVYMIARRAAPLLKAQGEGLFLMTSSTAGLFGYPYRTPYAAAKWAIVGLTKSLAMELGPYGVRVNCICPGAVEGPRMDRVVANEAEARCISEEEVRKIYVKGVSMKTWVTAGEIAETALFLASDHGRKISGQALSVDGHTETIGD